MILISHPTGNTFVRALLQGLADGGRDYTFHTTLAADTNRWWTRCLPTGLRREWMRRSFPVPQTRCRQHPVREFGRLLSARLGLAPLVRHETGVFSVDAVYRGLDRAVAGKLRTMVGTQPVQSVYAYEDGAHATFVTAKERGIQCCYELPIAYWETCRQLLSEEVQRWPEWEPTLLAARDSDAKLQRKTEELLLADVVICPSQFVYRSLPPPIRNAKRCVIAEFGSPAVPVLGLNRGGIPAGFRARATQTICESQRLFASAATRPEGRAPLRVLFAGAMTQRKGLADVFAAMRLLRRSHVELVVMGSPLLPLEFYRRQFSNFLYEPPRAHGDFLELMQQCDVLVLPSIVEGRALVQQEALSCGLPLIVTANAGGEDLIEAGQTGWLVPTGDPEALAEKLTWFTDHRRELPAMREAARTKAAAYTWERYAQKILQTVAPTKPSASTLAAAIAA